jgi:hypothetical protein
MERRCSRRTARGLAISNRARLVLRSPRGSTENDIWVPRTESRGSRLLGGDHREQQEPKTEWRMLHSLPDGCVCADAHTGGSGFQGVNGRYPEEYPAHTGPKD